MRTQPLEKGMRGTRERVYQSKVRKALKRTNDHDEWLIIRATGDTELMLILNHGWEMLSAVSNTWQGSQLTSIYAMRKRRAEVVLDILIDTWYN